MSGAPSSSPTRVLADGGESRPESSAAGHPGFLPRSRSQPPARATAATRRLRPSRQGLAHHGDLHIQSVLLRRSRGRAGKDSTGRSPSSDFVGYGSADELAEQEQGFGDALRTDMATRCSCN